MDVGETYTLSETTTPAGYKPAAPVTFVLANDGTIDTSSPDTTAVVGSGNLIKFKNEPTSFNIYVVDMEHPETKISGAKVWLRIRSSGQTVREWQSGTSPEVVTGLTVGTEYTLRTNEPYPSGYRWSGDEVFRVKADGTAEPVQGSWAAFVDENGDILVRMLKIYNVTLVTNGGTINSGNVTQYAYSRQVILPTDVTNGNLRFGGWYKNADFSGEKKELITAGDTGDKTFYAKWEYTVQFDNNASDAQGTMEDQDFVYGVEQTLSQNAFTREGYGFAGWKIKGGTSDGQDVAADYSASTLTPEAGGIVTLAAQWALNSYTVSYDFDGGTLTSWDTDIFTPVTDGQGNTTGLTQTVNHGSAASDPGSPSKDGSSFQGWYLSETSYDFNTPVTTDNIILKAKWDLIIRRVTVTPGANMTKTEESGDVNQNVNSGSEIKAVVYTADDGYYFPENYSSVGSVNGISVTRNSDTQITVSGTPTADASITPSAPSSKSANTVADPVITSEPGADATSPSTVSIICDTEGAEIWYTTDGSDPMESTNPNRQRYSDKFTVSGTTTVKAYAKKDGMFPSSVKEKTIIIAEPMTQKVIIHHVKNNGSWGIPADMADDQAELTITIKDGEVVSEGKVTMEISDGKKDSGEIEVTFIPKVENLSDITVKGPAELIGAVPISQKYKLSYKASFKDVINIYVTWDDGKTSTEEKIKVEALPEDEVGAYKILQDGTKMYLLFHTYDICMDWLGSDDLCRGYERCFHKVWPYDINWAK